MSRRRICNDLVFACVLASTACGSLLNPRRPGSTLPPRQSFVWKHVAEKRDPVYLIAIDGTECTTTKEKYENTSIGDRVLCLWRAR